MNRVTVMSIGASAALLLPWLGINEGLLRSTTSIVENAPTLNDEGQSVDCPVNYVLEVNAGWSRKHGVVSGQHVIFEGVTR